MSRTPKDYAIEHAEYLATDAEALLNAMNEHASELMALEEGEGDIERCEQAEQTLGESMARLRSGIYEFRKRRDRALSAAQPAQPVGPLFWYRPLSDGVGYEGPIHDASIEDVRKRSGAWVPLYAAAPAQPAQEPIHCAVNIVDN